jgi:hypothetical protein
MTWWSEQGDGPRDASPRDPSSRTPLWGGGDASSAVTQPMPAQPTPTEFPPTQVLPTQLPPGQVTPGHLPTGDVTPGQGRSPGGHARGARSLGRVELG